MLNRYSKDLSEKLAEKCRDFTNQRLVRCKRCHKKCITEEVISSSFLILSYWFILQHNNISRLKQARNADHIRYTYTIAMEQPAAGEFLLLPIVFARIFHHFQLIFPSPNTATHAPNNAPQHKNRAFLRFHATRQNSPKMGIFQKSGIFSAGFTK